MTAINQTLNSQNDDKVTGLNWPPQDEDFIKVAKWATKLKKDFKNVLVYVKYNPLEPILIFDPQHICPGPKEVRHLTVTNQKTGAVRDIEVILIEDD